MGLSDCDHETRSSSIVLHCITFRKRKGIDCEHDPPQDAGVLELWAKQEKWHPGDRQSLFAAVAAVVSGGHPGQDVAADNDTPRFEVFYPGSYVDIAPSFVFPSVTYLDMDKRTPRFFGDHEGILEILAQHEGSPPDPALAFIHGDYGDTRLLEAHLGTKEEEKPQFDLLVSLYAGFISEHCTPYLKIGGRLLVNPSHGDAAMASIDPRYVLSGVVVEKSESTTTTTTSSGGGDGDDGGYHIEQDNLETHLIPKKKEHTTITVETLHQTGRGIPYTKSPFAYLFTRVA
jgi:hypothetical protein